MLKERNLKLLITEGVPMKFLLLGLTLLSSLSVFSSTTKLECEVSMFSYGETFVSKQNVIVDVHDGHIDDMSDEEYELYERNVISKQVVTIDDGIINEFVFVATKFKSTGKGMYEKGEELIGVQLQQNEDDFLSFSVYSNLPSSSKYFSADMFTENGFGFTCKKL